MNSPDKPPPPDPSVFTPLPRKKSLFGRLYLGIGVFVLIALGSLIVQLIFGDVKQAVVDTRDTTPSTDTPGFKTEIVIPGLQQPWEIAFLPDGRMLYTERDGTLSIYENGQVREAKISGVVARGEGGLMGLTLDPQFDRNRYMYLCFNAATDIRVIRLRLEQDLSPSTEEAIITGIPANITVSPGRHSGCRIGFGPDGNLWVGTGDAAQGDTSVQPRSLGGKVLRITRDGRPVAGNIKGAFDPRVFSYGHRNVQGLAFFPNTRNGVIGLSIEHGSDRDDEVNELRRGNFGWAPPAAGYDESVPMTDTGRFPDAISAIWSSGVPTQAPSGGTIIGGSAWKGWNGALAMAVLKDRHVKVLRLNDKNKVTKEERILAGAYGRIRTVTQGPDGALYLATGNGTDDKIIRLSPL